MFIYGRNVCDEYLKSEKHIIKVYATREFKEQELLQIIKSRSFDINYLSKDELDTLVDDHSQGIAFEIHEFNYTPLTSVIRKEQGFIVVLDQITDVANFGAIVRICESAGVDAIVILKSRSVSVDSRAYKTSAGALSNMKVVEVSNLANTFKTLKEANYWVVGSTLSAKQSYDNVDYNMNLCLVVGNESDGIRPLTEKLCDILVKIPMKGKVNSLNASVATGILVYEVLRNRG